MRQFDQKGATLCIQGLEKGLEFLGHCAVNRWQHLRRPAELEAV